MCLVLQNDLRLVLVFVAERYLDLLRILDHVIVGEDPSVFAEDEARTLSRLGHNSIKKIECQGGGSDVYDRR